MKTSASPLRELDAKALYECFLAGAEKLCSGQTHLNRLNVFPVPDGDTGTNLASTMRSIIDSPIPVENVRDTAMALADAALTGARGNSGIIFAQFLQGFASEVGERPVLTTRAFGEHMRIAVRYAYASIARPVEGTMITVIREWAESFHHEAERVVHAEAGHHFAELLERSLVKANESLQRTKELLEPLRRANVVDAGGKGFVLFLEGMLDVMKHGPRPADPESRVEINLGDFADVDHGELTFRYCCEALISLDPPKSEAMDRIRMLLADLGDSLVVAGSSRKIRVHLHSDRPAEMIGRLAEWGVVAHQKIDDMAMQKAVASRRIARIALVTDSTCDLPQELLNRHQIHVVPLFVHAGRSAFLDRLSITSEQFYRILDEGGEHPTTAQPTYKDFLNRYSWLGSQYDSVLSLHLSKNMSGTWSNGGKAARQVSDQNGKPIAVIDTKRLTSALGLMVLRAARAVESGSTHADLAARIPHWHEKSLLIVPTVTTRYMVKSGRLSPVKGLLAKLLGARPVITVNAEGRTEVFAKPLSVEASRKVTKAEIEAFLAKGELWGWSVSHVRNPEECAWWVDTLRALTGMEPEFATDASPVLGVNAGPGTVAIALQLV